MQDIEQKKRKRRTLLIEPPFNRLYKNTYSLDKYPLGLAYLACTIEKETDWFVKIYNADFNPDSKLVQLSYPTNTGYRNYIKNLSDLSVSIWLEIQQKIKSFYPDVVGISAKSQNFTSACNIARIVKNIK